MLTDFIIFWKSFQKQGGMSNAKTMHVPVKQKALGLTQSDKA